MPVSIAAWPLLVPQKIRSVSHQSGKRAFYLFLFRQVLRPVVIFLQISSYARVTVCLGKNWWIDPISIECSLFFFSIFPSFSLLWEISLIRLISVFRWCLLRSCSFARSFVCLYFAPHPLTFLRPINEKRRRRKRREVYVCIMKLIFIARRRTGRIAGCCFSSVISWRAIKWHHALSAVITPSPHCLATLAHHRIFGPLLIIA